MLRTSSFIVLRCLLPCWFALFLFIPVAAAQLTIPGQQPAATAESSDPKKVQSSIDELIRLIENDDTRAELIARLKARNADAPGAEAQPAAPETRFINQVAQYTRAMAEQAADFAGAVADMARRVGWVFSGATSADLSGLVNAMGNLLLPALGLIATFMVARLITGRIWAASATRGQGQPLLRRIGWLLMAVAADALGVLVASGIGNIIALAVGTTGRMGLNQSLFLNAFLIIELVKVGMRAVLVPNHSALRLLPLSDTTANYWYFWLSRIASILGYTFLFLAPIVAVNASWAAAQMLRIVVMLTVVTTAIVIILQNRDDVRHLLARRAAAGRGDLLSRALALLGRFWHLVAIAYLLALFFIWLANPVGALPFMLAATIQTVIACALGILVGTFITRFVSLGMRLPDEVKERLPLLETRLNAFVPHVLNIIRTGILIVVLIAVAQIWGMVDFIGWLATEGGQRITGSIVSALFIILVGAAIYLAFSSWVEYRLNPNNGRPVTARHRTLLSLFRNAFTIALVVIITMLALAEIGVNIAPLLAGAGVLGLAIGFGAQKLVQDIINGIFIQFENAMNEGDVVILGAFSGVVEKLTIRSVSIRSLDGTLHVIPFSSVDAVSNMMKGFSFHLAEIRVSHDENIPAVKDAMNEAFERLLQTEHKEKIIGPLEMHGMTEFRDSVLIVRARIKTLPGDQWATGRTYNELIKQVFEERGIAIPYPQLALRRPKRKLARQQQEAEA